MLFEYLWTISANPACGISFARKSKKGVGFLRQGEMTAFKSVVNG